MADWLTRASAAFRGRKETAAQPFRIACECGSLVTGMRTPTHQKVTCLECRRQVLALPADPYPFVKRAPSAAPPKRANTVVQPQEPRSKSKTDKSSPSPAGDSATKKSTKDRAASAENIVELPPAVKEGKARRRIIRLIITAVVVLVSVTSWSLWNRSLRDRARWTVPAASEAGITALHQGEFLLATEKLGLAVRGLETLGRTDAEARSIRQAYQEAVAANGLSSKSLAELAASFLADSSEDRQQHFQSEFGSKWLIFDAYLIRQTSENESWLELDVPFLVNNRPLTIRCESPALLEFATEATPLTSQRVLFAGQIAEWILPESKQQPIAARIRTTNAFLWNDYDSLQAIGDQVEYPEDEPDLRDLLKRQTQTSNSAP